MKPIISHLAENRKLILFPILLFFTGKWKQYFFLLLGMIILAGCFRKFYNTGTNYNIDPAKIEQLKAANKYFIIHYKDSIRELSNINISNQVLSGKTGQLPAVHRYELNPDINKSNVFKYDYKKEIMSEVHLYVNKNKAATTGYPEVQVPLSDIYRMDIYEFDKGKSSTSTVLSLVGIAVPVAVLIIILASGSGSSAPPPTTTGTTTCSCPQVYIEQKGNFNFQNGIFSGAVYANLERMDYLALGTIQPENSTIRLRISSHDDEAQFLNSVKLMGIYNEPGSKILADRYGKFYAIKNPVLPDMAIGSEKENLKEELSKADGNSFEFDSFDPKGDFSKAYLTFRKPLDNKKATLMIRAKNSNWAATVNNEYTLLFGEDYARFRDKRENTNSNKMEANVLKEGLPIKVYVENGEKWEYAGYFPLVGTEGYREMAMEISLPDNKAENFRIKLETVYRFWDLDYTAIDYTPNDLLNPIAINPLSVMHTTNGDQKSQLVTKDKLYVQLNNEENIDLEFQAPLQNGNKTISYFLVSSGYYHIQKTYPVKANISRLNEFKKEGEFDRFSKEKYKELEYWQSIVKKSE